MARELVKCKETVYTSLSAIRPVQCTEVARVNHIHSGTTIGIRTLPDGTNFRIPITVEWET